MGRFSKRAFDVVASALGLLFLSPLFIILAVYIKRSSPGPVFYRGTRVGRGGKFFNILKFRTMYETPESYAGPPITSANDRRVTPLGQWLRDTKLNELPQLWNVLKGEMSLVGPRPEDPAVVDTWPRQVYQEVLSVRPGITSPASIIYRDEEKTLHSDSVMDKYLSDILPSKLRLDQLYVREQSFLGDLDVIFLTLLALLPNLRKQKFPEQVLFWGPLARFVSRHLNWFLVDAVVAFLSVAIAGSLWRTVGPLDLGLGPAALMAAGIGLLFGTVNAALGLNNTAWSQARPVDSLGLAFSGGLTAVVLIVLNRLLTAWPDLPLGMWALASVLAILGFVATRYRLRLLTGIASYWLNWRGSAFQVGERALVIGAGQLSQFTIQLINQSKIGRVLRIVGLVDDDPRKHRLQINGYRVLGTTQEIPELVRQHDIGLLLFSISNIPPEQMRTILAVCRQTGVRVVRIPNIYDLFSACLLDSQTGQRPVASTECDGHIPVSVIVSWLMELERLANPGDEAMLARLQQMREELAVHSTREAAHE